MIDGSGRTNANLATLVEIQQKMITNQEELNGKLTVVSKDVKAIKAGPAVAAAAADSHCARACFWNG
jgi:hypothetical protein